MQKEISAPNRRSLALWAADCAEHVLPYFEKEHPKDDRPRKAIGECRAWARSGLPMRMSVIRAASLSAHAAARNAKTEGNDAACFAARAAGQAVATAHVPQHAYGASYYSIKAVAAADPAHAEARIAKELDWQSRRLPKHLKRGWQDWQSRRLPKDLKLIVEKMKVRKQKVILAYPKNKAHFLRLIRFGKEIITLCHSHGTNPILYGSLAHFLHTGDTGMRINDLDFLVSRSKLPGIFRALRRKGAKEFGWKIGTTHTLDLMRAARHAKGKTLLVRFPDWNGIVIVRGDLRVDLDDFVRTYAQDKRLPKDFVDLSIDDMRIRMISLPSLKKLYRIARAAEKGKDKAKIKERIKRLEKSPKRA